MGERQTGMLGKPVAVREETGSSGYTLRPKSDVRYLTSDVEREPNHRRSPRFRLGIRRQLDPTRQGLLEHLQQCAL